MLTARRPGDLRRHTESAISLVFLRRYPTAAAAAHLGQQRLAAFIAKQGYSGKRPQA